MNWFDGFELRRFNVNGVEIAARVGGAPQAPALLMLHGFPQTHVIWNRVVRELQGRFRFVLPDLRGYGDSAKPVGQPDHSNYSKRSMAQDLEGLMTQLGIERFGLVGHDRGGRVAHRLALDHPERVWRLALIDIAPTLDMYAATDMRFASLYYHWFHLIQPTPMPERMIGADPKFYLHWTLGGWGAKSTSYIESQAMAEYERCFCTPQAIHGACEDYRASAGIDLEHDRASRAAGQRVACDMLVLWGERGVVARLFDPLTLWQAQCAGQVSGQPLPGGHFIPEELPAQLAQNLQRFFD
jgi:haloacetate dehalogenase